MLFKKYSAIFFAIALTGIVPAFAHGDSSSTQDLKSVPPKLVEMYLDGFHNYKTDSKLAPKNQLQLRVAHYCTHYSADLIECILYDRNSSEADSHPRLLGIEYVITDKAHAALSKSEQKYWHPHNGEVSSGMLRLPGMEEGKEKEVLDFVKTTWGKTWHAWNPERKVGDGEGIVWPELPLGPARLMWSVAPEDETDATKKAVSGRK